MLLRSSFPHKGHAHQAADDGGDHYHNRPSACRTARWSSPLDKNLIDRRVTEGQITALPLTETIPSQTRAADGMHAPDSLPPAGDQLICIADIRAIFKLGRTAAYDLTHRPGFPDPIRVSPHCYRWAGQQSRSIRRHTAPPARAMADWLRQAGWPVPAPIISGWFSRQLSGGCLARAARNSGIRPGRRGRAR